MCPKDTWLKLHKPELLDKFKPAQFELHLMEHGGEIEVRARKLFTHGRLISPTEDDACLETRWLMGESGDAFFRAAFIADSLSSAYTATK